MRSKYLLSVCISSYNKGIKCYDLIKKILNGCDDRVNVVVTDDCSDEKTINKISSISHERYRLCRNRTNLGAVPSWFETISNGDGYYVLHILDRDYIDLDLLNSLLDLLELSEIGVGYVGHYFANKRMAGKKEACFYRPGDETLSKIGCVPLHPTGFFIRKDLWDSDRFKPFFFDEKKYGIYPHSYIVGMVASTEGMLILPGTFWRCIYSSEASLSKFYQNKKAVAFWWEPDCIFLNCVRMLAVLSALINDNSRADDLIVNCYMDGLYRSTIGYAFNQNDSRQMSHYSQQVRRVPEMELLFVGLKYSIKYVEYIYRHMNLNYGLFRRLKRCFINNYKDIVNYYW